MNEKEMEHQIVSYLYSRVCKHGMSIKKLIKEAATYRSVLGNKGYGPLINYMEAYEIKE